MLRCRRGQVARRRDDAAAAVANKVRDNARLFSPPIPMHDYLFYALDVIGTIAFAMSGAFRAVRYELDLLGVIALGVATGVGGGIIRDVLLGITPPLVLVDQSYVLLCIAAAVVVFVAAPRIAPRWDYVLGADAVGLAVFTVIGASKAEALGAVPLTILLMGVITACGGGVIRDLLVGEIPAVLTHDFYATAALVGGAVWVGLGMIDLSDSVRIYATVAVTLTIRILAMRYALTLPKVKSLPESPSALTRKRKEEKNNRGK